MRDLASSTSRSLLQDSSASGSTFSGADSDAGGSAQSSSSFFGEQVGPGDVFVRATAFSSGLAFVRSQFASNVTADISKVEGGGIAAAVARARADAFAFAIASAFASASVSIVSTSDGGRACGRGTATARQAADATAEVLVQVCLSQCACSCCLTLSTCVGSRRGVQQN